MVKPRGLGRGLDALLGTDSEMPAGDAMATLAVDALQPGRFQPRTRMDQDALAELAESIRAQGVMQPILVRPLPEGRYEIVAGERRWRAARMAGLSSVPALVREVSDSHALAMALIENIQREDLNPLEQAAGIKRLIDKGLPPAASELAEPYLAAIDPKLETYPGSPVLVRALLRRQDRLEAVELHPDDAASLKATFAGDIQTRVIALDGWLALGAHVPPKEKRGLVLVDPPFEEDGEWQRLTDGLVRAHRKWATGTYLAWYPVKDTAAVAAFVRRLARLRIAKMLRMELVLATASGDLGLRGSGLIVCDRGR